MNLSLKKLASLMGAAMLAAPTLQAAQPNIVLIMTDDIGTGWFPFHADRLKVSDVEPEIAAVYQTRRNNRTEIDIARHIETARNCMPFLDRIAKQGVIFDNAFATSALCAPSRSGLLTGTFHQQWGHYWNKDVDDHGLPIDRVVIAEPLKAAGYATAMLGKWHVAKKDPDVMRKVWTEQMGQALPIPGAQDPRRQELARLLKDSGYETSSISGQHPLDRGFDYYYGFNNHDSDYFLANDLWENRTRVPKRPPGEFLTDALSDKATQFIESSLGQNKPFFIYYAPLTLHGPIIPPPETYTAQFNSGHRYTDEYAGHLRGLDEGIRRIFETVEAKGQLDNTLFIFTSDNGCTLYNVPPYNAPNRGGKGTGWFGGLNVPLVVWGRNLTRTGISREIVSLADVMPTVLEYAGVPVPAGISGRSLVPYLTGKADKGPRDSLNSISIQSSRWSYFYDGKGENNTRDGELAPLYAWHFDGTHVYMRVTPTRAGLYKSLPDGLPEQVMLFDVSKDRAQRHNLASENRDKIERMDAALRTWLAELREPVTSQQEDFKRLLQPVGRP